MLDEKLVRKLQLKVKIQNIFDCKQEMGLKSCGEHTCNSCRGEYTEKHTEIICKSEYWSCTDPWYINKFMGYNVCYTVNECEECRTKVNEKIRIKSLKGRWKSLEEERNANRENNNK